MMCPLIRCGRVNYSAMIKSLCQIRTVDYSSCMPTLTTIFFHASIIQHVRQPEVSPSSCVSVGDCRQRDWHLPIASKRQAMVACELVSREEGEKHRLYLTSDRQLQHASSKRSHDSRRTWLQSGGVMATLQLIAVDPSEVHIVPEREQVLVRDKASEHVEKLFL